MLQLLLPSGLGLQAKPLLHQTLKMESSLWLDIHFCILCCVIVKCILDPTFYFTFLMQQSKMEDRLEEAITVLQRHASGQGGPGLSDVHTLLSSGMGLPQAFNSTSLGLGSRLPGLVRYYHRTTTEMHVWCFFFFCVLLTTFLQNNSHFYVLKVPNHHEDSVGLPSSGGLLNSHLGPASVQPGSQPESFTSKTSCCAFILISIVRLWWQRLFRSVALISVCLCKTFLYRPTQWFKSLLCPWDQTREEGGGWQLLCDR